MLPPFRKNLLFLPSCCSSSSSSQVRTWQVRTWQVRTWQVRTFLFRFPVLGFSSSSSPPPPQPHYKQLKGDKVRVSVWWDFDTCGVPSGVSFSEVAPSIMRALRTHGINGPVNFRAYGDVSQFSKFKQIALSSTGIHFCHITDEMRKHRKGKNACNYLFIDLVSWLCENPPPLHLFIICGDIGIHDISTLHWARMNNYNILVARPGMTCDVLRGATTIRWNWPLILKGEDFTGIHFNYPPDGPFDSWYGDSNVPLEPFSAAEEPTSLQLVKILEPSSDIKLGEVPESVSRLVKKISSSYPNGISIRDLRAELTKCDVPLGKPFYGYKNFSNFLVSIPHVQLLYLGKGKFCVHLIPSTTTAVKNNKQWDGTSTPVLGISSPPPPQPNYKQLKEDKVRVSVWWDFDTCGVPYGVSFSKVAHSIMGALRTHGIKCPVDIEAYGNLSQLSEINQEVLFLTGIDLHHVPGGKKHAHRYFMDWVSKNPAPAHLFIISGDRDTDFVRAVSELSNKSYNILLACPPKIHYVLCSKATIMWPWSSMLKGDFTGKYFKKYPPRWYVDSKVHVENSLSVAEEPTSSQNAEIHKPSSNMKLGGEIPESVSWQVRKILRLYPNGISIGDLRTKLSKCNLPLGEHFYGHEKFSNFLVSIPHVQLLDKGEGMFCVELISSTTLDNAMLCPRM